MAIGLTAPQSLLAISGIRIATTNAGIRYADRDDMVLIKFDRQATVAALFTQNKFCAAPVTVAKQHLQAGNVQALLINAGNANAGTGSIGIDNAIATCAKTAQLLSLEATQVLPFSTGVIGEQLPMDKLPQAIEKLTQSMSDDAWLAAANAIMTTDTVAKGISKQCQIDQQTITITGIVKGSGMICPDMATLLSYVATDAPISQAVLQQLLAKATAMSFNRITVDGDTSTNDALVLVATGKANIAEITSMGDPRVESLYQAIEAVLVSLATSVIRDAEGINKFVTIGVSGGQSQTDCAEVAYTVAHSPLVKTALFASDPNWGRILAAIGRARVTTLDISKVSITINYVLIIENGEPAVSYSEEKGQAVFDEEEITIDITIGDTGNRYQVWTSDLSHEYVSINADYRS